jgi:hypothetical protein
MPGAALPSGLYTLTHGMVRLTLVLKRDGQRISSVQVQGSLDAPAALADRVATAVRPELAKAHGSLRGR